MPKLKLNSVIGLRTKWSMSSEGAWRKSQRAGGIVLMITGVFLFFGNLLFFAGMESLIFSAILMSVSVAIVVAYTKKIALE